MQSVCKAARLGYEDIAWVDTSREGSPRSLVYKKPLSPLVNEATNLLYKKLCFVENYDITKPAPWFTKKAIYQWFYYIVRFKNHLGFRNEKKMKTREDMMLFLEKWMKRRLQRKISSRKA